MKWTSRWGGWRVVCILTVDWLQMGDLLFLTNYQEEDIRVGEMMGILYSDC
jgi:hypothetical protein